MKKGKIYEGVVEKIAFPNKGILHIEDRPIIVKNAIPGQKIQLQVNKVRKGKTEARLLAVLEKSPLEYASSSSYCEHFATCGGCTYQNIPYETQLSLKEGMVSDILQPFCKTPNIIEGIAPSPIQNGYRNKMEYSFGDEYKDGPLALGLHKRGSMYDIVNTTKCQIVSPDFNLILQCVLDHFAPLAIPFYHKMRHEGILRHLLVRKAFHSNEIMVALVTHSNEPEQTPLEDLLCLEELSIKLQNLALEGSITGFLHILNDSLADVVKSDATTIIFGRDYINEKLLDLSFKITPFSFFQTNSLGAEKLYEIACDFIADTNSTNKVVYDLYSGTGTIAQIISSVASKVIGVEIVAEAVEAAKENALQNGITNCDFIAGDVLKVLDEIEEKPDFIIVDPPRDGIHPKALKKIIAYSVSHIVYISCKPTSLARDLEEFMANGYEVERVKYMDMFPCTGHVETVVLMSRQNP